MTNWGNNNFFMTRNVPNSSLDSYLISPIKVDAVAVLLESAGSSKGLQELYTVPGNQKLKYFDFEVIYQRDRTVPTRSEIFEN